MPPKSNEPSEAEIVFNRANVALAKSQRLIASWLPPRTAEELASAKTDEELDKEDQDLFAPVPELLGVGAPVPKDSGKGIVKRKDTSSLEALRKQLLGRNASRAGLVQKDQSMPRPIAKASKLVHSDSEEDEGGRAAAFVSRKRQSESKVSPAAQSEDIVKTKLAEEDQDQAAEPAANPVATMAPKSQPSKRKASSFLDEMLAEKAKKKSKKKKEIQAGK